MEKVRLGVIGFGNIGTKHCRIVSEGNVPGMEVTAICVRSPKGIEAAKSQYPSVAVFDNATDLYRSGLCDLVLIATPHYDHPELAIEAFSHGLHVIVEKPAGVYTKQVLEMNAAAGKSGKVFAIMYNQLDLWQWMFGMPDKITSFVSFGKYYDIEVEDDVTAYFEYENGTTGTYITSTGEAPGTNRLEIACDMGRIVVENDKITFDKNEISEREFNKTFTGVFGSPKCRRYDIPVNGTAEQHAGILKNVASHILHGTELLAPGYEGINGLTISNAILYSAWTGNAVDVKNFPHEDFYNMLQARIN